MPNLKLIELALDDITKQLKIHNRMMRIKMIYDFDRYCKDVAPESAKSLTEDFNQALNSAFDI